MKEASVCASESIQYGGENFYCRKKYEIKWKSCDSINYTICHNFHTLISIMILNNRNMFKFTYNPINHKRNQRFMSGFFQRDFWVDGLTVCQDLCSIDRFIREKMYFVLRWGFNISVTADQGRIQVFINSAIYPDTSLPMIERTYPNRASEFLYMLYLKFKF